MWNLLAGYAGLRLDRPAGLRRARRLRARRARRRSGREPVPRRARWPAWSRRRSRCPRRRWSSASRARYFAVGTWAVAEVYRLLVANTGALGRGTGRTLKAVFPLARETRELVTYFARAGHRRGAPWSPSTFLRSRLGLGLMAVRDSEPASESLGVDVFRTKLAVYLLAAFGTGATGALIYLNLLRISPDAALLASTGRPTRSSSSSSAASARWKARSIGTARLLRPARAAGRLREPGT